MTRKRLLGSAGLVLALAACSSPAPPSLSAEPSASEISAPSLSASGIVGDPGSPVSLRPPGQPFEADDILAAMEGSQRPGGVPEALQTDEVATAIADVLWTLEGDPWDMSSAGGTCAADTCTLELAGSVAGGGGEDLWVLSVNPATAAVEVVTADLHAVPDEAAEALNRLARGSEGGGALDGMLLTSVRWQPPPDANRFVLAYRSGDEEESCSMDVELDIETLMVTEVDSSGC